MYFEPRTTIQGSERYGTSDGILQFHVWNMSRNQGSRPSWSIEWRVGYSW